MLARGNILGGDWITLQVCWVIVLVVVRIVASFMHQILTIQTVNSIAFQRRGQLATALPEQAKPSAGSYMIGHRQAESRQTVANATTDGATAKTLVQRRKWHALGRMGKARLHLCLAFVVAQERSLFAALQIQHVGRVRHAHGKRVLWSQLKNISTILTPFYLCSPCLSLSSCVVLAACCTMKGPQSRESLSGMLFRADRAMGFCHGAGAVTTGFQHVVANVVVKIRNVVVKLCHVASLLQQAQLLIHCRSTSQMLNLLT